MNYYVDSSVILRVLKGQKDAWKGWGRWEKAYCSTILRIECRRFVDRIRLEHAWSDEDVAAAGGQLLRLERVLTHVRLSGAIMERAGLPMPTTVKTLDAIHIATARLFVNVSLPASFLSRTINNRGGLLALSPSIASKPD